MFQMFTEKPFLFDHSNIQVSWHCYITYKQRLIPLLIPTWYTIFYINYIKLSSSTCFERHPLIFRRPMMLIVHVCSVWYSHSVKVNYCFIVLLYYCTIVLPNFTYKLKARWSLWWNNLCFGNPDLWFWDLVGRAL